MRIVSLAFLLIENCAYDTIYSVCEFVEIAKGFVLDRDKSFDILKGIGIVAVVLGHFIEPFRANHFVFKGIFVLIYSFHMPLFSFVSGYFGRFSSKSILNIVKVYFGFQFVYLIYQLVFKIVPFDMISILKALITPYWHLWYLFALFFWRVSLFLFSKIEKIYARVIVLFALFALALAAGLKELPLDFQRTLVFFPYFVFGFFFKEYYNAIRNFINEKKLLKYINIALLIAVMSYVFAISGEINVKIVSPYQAYEAGGYTMVDRLVFLAVAMVLVLLLTVNAGYVRSGLLEHLGRCTLPIYGFHGIVFKLMYKYKIIAKLCKLDKPLLIAIYVIVCVVLCIFVFSRSFFTKKRSFNLKKNI